MRSHEWRLETKREELSNADCPSWALRIRVLSNFIFNSLRRFFRRIRCCQKHLPVWMYLKAFRLYRPTALRAVGCEQVLTFPSSRLPFCNAPMRLLLAGSRLIVGCSMRPRWLAG